MKRENERVLQLQSNLEARRATAVSVGELIHQLSSLDSMVREHARESLVAAGKMAVNDLIVALETTNEHARWEACKALTQIADPSSVPALIRALESEHDEIRWVAGEGLVNIGGCAVEPLLRALIDRAIAHTILAGAHHVLHAFARRASDPVLEPVLAAIAGPQPAVNVPPAAENALLRWAELSAELASGHRQVLRTQPLVPEGTETGAFSWM